MNNVVQFTRPGVVDTYSDYWPTATYGQLLQRLWDNLPDEGGSAEYGFVVKPDLEGSTCSVVVRRKGSDTVVLFNACDDIQDNNDLKAWFVLNDKRLRRLLTKPGKMTIVGKVGQQDGERTLLVHYIIFNDEVYLDEVSLRKLLEPGDFGSAIYAVASTDVVTLTMNKNTGGLSFPFMNNVSEGLTILGLPVNVIVPRENGGAPIFKASLVHMRFMSFTYTSPQRSVALEPAA